MVLGEVVKLRLTERETPVVWSLSTFSDLRKVVRLGEFRAMASCASRALGRDASTPRRITAIDAGTERLPAPVTEIVRPSQHFSCAEVSASCAAAREESSSSRAARMDARWAMMKVRVIT